MSRHHGLQFTLVGARHLLELVLALIHCKGGHHRYLGLFGQLVELVYVNFDEGGVVGGGEGLVEGGDLLAGAAPRGSEVDDDLASVLFALLDEVFPFLHALNWHEVNLGAHSLYGKGGKGAITEG